MNMAFQNEQISLFDLLEVKNGATSCFTGRTEPLESMTDQMNKLVPEGEFLGYVGVQPLILRRTKLKRDEIPEGHEFYHYMVGGTVYAGIFVGADDTE